MANKDSVWDVCPSMTSISIKQSLKFPDLMENVKLLEQMNLK